MLSNQTIQKLIQEIKRISGFDCSIWNEKAECLAMTNVKTKPRQAEVEDLIERYNSQGTEESAGEQSLFLLESGESLYVLAVDGADERAVLAGRFGISHLESLVSMNRGYQALHTS